MKNKIPGKDVYVLKKIKFKQLKKADLFMTVAQGELHGQDGIMSKVYPNQVVYVALENAEPDPQLKGNFGIKCDLAKL